MSGKLEGLADVGPSPDPGIDSGSHEYVRPYAWYVLGVLVLLYTLNFIDRQILSILAQEIKADLRLDDSQLGFLYGTAFAIFYALFGIPLGRLADTWYRGRLMAIGLALWSIMTALSGFATSYAQFAVARIGVGVGEASASPAAFSMLGGFFPRTRRALAVAIYSSGVYLGMGLSLPLGGYVLKTWKESYPNGNAPFGLQGWQAAFLAVGLPGLLLAAWILTLREPPRVSALGKPMPLIDPRAWQKFFRDIACVLPPLTLWSASGHPGGLRQNLVMLLTTAVATGLLGWWTGDRAQWISYGFGLYAIGTWIQTLRYTDPPMYRLIWGTREVWFAVIGFGSLAIITYAFGFWAAPYAIRSYSISPARVGALIGIPGAVASALGVIAGGRLSDAWKQRDSRGRVFVGMLSAAASAPLLIAMFLASNFRIYALISPLVYFAANLWPGSAIATYQDLVLPRMYGTAGATYLVGGTMIGLALGPYLSGKIATVTGSLQTGVFSLLVAPVAVLTFLWLLSRTISQAESSKIARAQAAGEIV
jgi:MFS family permease